MQQLHDKNGKELSIGDYVLTRTNNIGIITDISFRDEVYFHVKYNNMPPDKTDYLFIGQSLTYLTIEEVMLRILES